MLAIIMAGGVGKRMLSREEKPMLLLKGKPMVNYVLRALRDSNQFEKIIALVSNNTPRTAQFLSSTGVEIANSSGTDYVKDLNCALELVKPNTALIISADIPLIDSSTIKKIVSSFRSCKKPCLTVMVSKAILDDLDMSADYCIEHNGMVICNTGISIIDSSSVDGYSKIDEEFLVMDKVQLAVNVNTKQELQIAERILP
ncbi:MAG: NTP transferase domain-containing protein [Nitrososphaerales archaeon]